MELIGFASIGVLIVIQAVIIAYGYGKLNQRVSGMITSGEQETTNRKSSNKDMVNAFRSREVLPDCQRTFTEISDRLTRLETKIDIMLNNRK